MNTILTIITALALIFGGFIWLEYDANKFYEQCMAKGIYSHQTCWAYSR